MANKLASICVESIGTAYKHHIFVGHCIRVGSIDLPTPDYIILMIMIQMQGTCRNGFYRALVFDIPGVLPLDVSVMLRVY